MTAPAVLVLPPPSRVMDLGALIWPNRHALLLQTDGIHLPIADDTIDLIVTSPPYGAGISYAHGGDVPATEWLFFMRAWLLEAYRSRRTGSPNRAGGWRSTFRST